MGLKDEWLAELGVKEMKIPELLPGSSKQLCVLYQLGEEQTRGARSLVLAL